MNWTKLLLFPTLFFGFANGIFAQQDLSAWRKETKAQIEALKMDKSLQYYDVLPPHLVEGAKKNFKYSKVSAYVDVRRKKVHYIYTALNDAELLRAIPDCSKKTDCITPGSVCAVEVTKDGEERIWRCL